MTVSIANPPSASATSAATGTTSAPGADSAALHQAPNRRHELARVNRLGQVHLESTAQRPGPIFRPRKGGQRRSRNIAHRGIRGRAQLLDEGEAVHLRHSQIDDEHFRIDVANPLQRFERRGHRCHASPGRFQDDAEQRQRLGLIVDGQHAHAVETAAQARQQRAHLQVCIAVEWTRSNLLLLADQEPRVRHLECVLLCWIERQERFVDHRNARLRDCR